MTRVIDIPARSLMAVVGGCAVLLLLVGLASNAAPISSGDPTRSDEVSEQPPDQTEMPGMSGLVPEQRIAEDPVVFPPYVDVIVAVVALVAAAAALVMLLRSHLIRWRLLSWARPGGAQATQQPASEAEVADQLAAAAADMRRGLLDGDARLAVQRCYALVESGFGSDELARHDAETPLQYLHRIFGVADGSDGRPDGVDQPLRRLTSLFERARFSDQPVSEDMRADAAEALSQIENFYRSRATTRLTDAASLTAT